MRTIARVLATWFGCGLSPKAPGTVGSLGSLVLWVPLLYAGVAWWVLAVVSFALFVVGVWASGVVVEQEAKADPQIVVLDEVVGMGITLCAAHFSPVSIVVGFALFRLFDIWKPWPVSYADRKVKGGFGVMLDDVFAGFYAVFFLWLFESFVFSRGMP
jgi:phosphatidylglycerophosphatase A